MRFVPFWRTGTAPGCHAIIGTALYCALGQGRTVKRTGIRSQFMDTSRDIDDYPVPPPRTRRRIGIVHRHGKALGALGRTAPFEFGRFVLAGTAKTIELEALGYHVIGFYFRTGKFEA